MTTPVTTEHRTRQIVANVLGLPLADVTSETAQEAVEKWDSMNIINMMVAVESEFGIALAGEDAGRFVSVGAIIALLRERGVG
jgi:acyl carrier protein